MPFQAINTYTALSNASFVLHLDSGIAITSEEMRMLFTDNTFCWIPDSIIQATSAKNLLTDGVSIEFLSTLIEPPPREVKFEIKYEKPPLYYDENDAPKSYWDVTLYGGYGGKALLYDRLVVVNGFKWEGNQWTSIIGDPPVLSTVKVPDPSLPSGYRIYYIDPYERTPTGDIVQKELIPGTKFGAWVWDGEKFVVKVGEQTLTRVYPDPLEPPLTFYRPVSNDNGVTYASKPVYCWHPGRDDVVMLEQNMVVSVGLPVNSQINNPPPQTYKWSGYMWVNARGANETNSDDAIALPATPVFVSNEFYTCGVCSGILKDNAISVAAESRVSFNAAILINIETYNTVYPTGAGIPLDPKKPFGQQILWAILLPAREKPEFAYIVYPGESDTKTIPLEITINSTPAYIYYDCKQIPLRPNRHYIPGTEIPPEIPYLLPYEVLMDRRGIIFLYEAYDYEKKNADNSEYDYEYVGKEVVIKYAWKEK